MTATRGVHRDRAPVWSPDGKRIAFISNRDSSGPYNEVWSINSDGSGLQQITYTSGAVTSVPVWSPDGTRLAYPDGGYDAFILEVGRPWKERPPQRLPRMGEPRAHFMVRAWSPDGGRLAGERRGDDGSPAGTVIYSFESGEFERVTDFGWCPQWLNDGRRLLFHGQGKICLVDSRSRKVHEVLSMAPQNVAPYRFALSRDSRWIYSGVTRYRSRHLADEPGVVAK